MNYSEKLYQTIQELKSLCELPPATIANKHMSICVLLVGMIDDLCQEFTNIDYMKNGYASLLNTSLDNRASGTFQDLDTFNQCMGRYIKEGLKNKLCGADDICNHVADSCNNFCSYIESTSSITKAIESANKSIDVYNGIISELREYRFTIGRCSALTLNVTNSSNVLKGYLFTIQTYAYWLNVIRKVCFNLYNNTVDIVNMKDATMEAFDMLSDSSDSLYDSLSELYEGYEYVFDVFEEDADEEKQNNPIAKIISSIRKLIKTAIDSVTKFFNRMFVDKETMLRYEEFKKIIAENPEFKNKKITIRDFKKMNSSYENIIKEIDNRINQAKNERNEAASSGEEFVDNVMGKIKQTQKSAGTVMNVDLALRMAESNRHVAKMIKDELEKENGYMAKIEQDIGTDRAADFKKKIDSSSKVFSLHRLKVRALFQWHKDMGGALDRTVADFGNIFNTGTGKMDHAKRVQNVRLIKDIAGGANQVAGDENFTKDMMKQGAKHYVRNVKNKAKEKVSKFSPANVTAQANAKAGAIKADKKNKELRKFFGA